MAVNEEGLGYQHPVYKSVAKIPGGNVAVGSIDALLNWGAKNSMWVFPMATSCCGIELMAAAAARVDLDRMGTIVRGSPRQADVMVVAGTITVKMAPRVRKLWDQMPEPKWCIAMGSCAISGDFYRDIYSVVPGIDTIIPVDVYIPGCPPNPEALMQGLQHLQQKVKARRSAFSDAKTAEEGAAKKSAMPQNVKRLTDPSRDPAITAKQTELARKPGDDAGTTPPALPDWPEAYVPAHPQQEWAEVLKAKFGMETLPKDAAPLIPAARVVEAARAARDNGYTVFSYVVASHWPAPKPKPAADGTTPPPGKDEYEVSYGLRRPGPGAAMATFRVRVPVDEPVDSLAGVYAGADWQEREQHDLLGVKFRGHPDLRRIMLPMAWVGHPLMKDFPIDAPCAPWR